MTTYTIKNARIIDPASKYDSVGHILIVDSKISEFGPDVSPQGEIIDASGLIAAPGLIDIRVSTGEPGTEHRETIASAAEAAAAGGVTSMVVTPNTLPVIDDMSLIKFIESKAETSKVNVYTSGALTYGLNGTSMTELGLMSEAGAVMFSNGENPVEDSQIMRRLLSYSARFNALIANRPKDPSLSKNTNAHSSDMSARLGLSGEPSISERIMIERDVALSELTGGRLLIDMISSSEGVESVRRAKTRDLDIVCSVSINNLALNELDIGDYRTFAKLDPPLREESDRQSLLSAVNDGTVDVIVSNHDPRPAGQKRLPFAEAANGAVGLEILLAAGLSQVATGALDLHKFLTCLTINPAEILDLPGGRIAVGSPADIVLFDADMPWVCNGDDLRSLSNNTPFDGHRFSGRVLMTFCGGEKVFELDRG